MLNQLDPQEVLREAPKLEERAYAASGDIHNWVLMGGEPRRQAADVLHGVQLGHPLHPVLTDITIGAWVFGSLLDLLGLTTRSRGIHKAADTLIALGNLSALPTALSGLTDFSTIPKKAAGVGAVHGLLNAGGLILNVLSSRHRAAGRRRQGVLLSLVNQAVLVISAWLGGEMVFRYKVGVNRIPEVEGPDEWEPVMLAGDLPERTPIRMEVAGAPVLIYRYEGQVFAIGAVCGHEGGPLDEGSFDGACVTCPWHQSVYDLRDGSVVHGPSTYAAPLYETRTFGGRIELRRRAHPATAAAKELVSELSDKAGKI